MVSLPAFPPANGHVTGMPRRHKPDAESDVPIVCLCITEHVGHTYLGIPERNPGIPRPEEYLGFPRVYPSITGVTNYRCINCLSQYIKQIILQILLNCVYVNYLLILSTEINNTSK